MNNDYDIDHRDFEKFAEVEVCAFQVKFKEMQNLLGIMGNLENLHIISNTIKGICVFNRKDYYGHFDCFVEIDFLFLHRRT